MPFSTKLPLHHIHPLRDSRWEEFVQTHPRSSIFHTIGWLEALRRTYGYEPMAITTSPPDGILQNAAVFCKVKSWLTGNRLVGLPFADHCDVLAEDAHHAAAMISHARKALYDGMRYVEFRPIESFDGDVWGGSSSHTFCLHHLDLQPDLDTLLHNCHFNSTQRKIHRAEREGLICEESSSTRLLDTFYGLLLLTRRRHLLPPQPKSWFQNLIQCFGQALRIRVARKDSQPIAAILTLRHKDILVYKYGCSDARLHNLGGMQFLIWRSIEEAKRQGLTLLDLGRSDLDNSGLITFKDRWGARRMVITYKRLVTATPPPQYKFLMTEPSSRKLLIEKAFSHLPNRMQRLLGSLMYRHIG